MTPSDVIRCDLRLHSFSASLPSQNLGTILRMAPRGTESFPLAETVRSRSIKILEQARQDALTVARLLVGEFGAKRVWLFGSVLTGRGLRQTSDIDLAVERLPEEQFFRAVGRALQTSRFDVDLKTMEKLPGSWREKILHEGKELS